MGLIEGFKNMFEDITESTRETYRNFRDRVEFQWDIDSSQRLQDESKADAAREKRKWAETMEKVNRELWGEGELVINNTGT